MYAGGYNEYAYLSNLSITTWLIVFGIAIISIIGEWMIFEKAGKPGWASIIPIYSDYVLCKIAVGNGWKFLICLIPFVGWIYAFVIMVKLSKSFGQSGWFAVGLILFPYIFEIILGFNDAEYIGPNGKPIRD